MTVELHFHGDFFAPRLGSRDDESSEPAPTPTPPAPPEESASGDSGAATKAGVGALIALLVLFGFALAVRKLRGGGEPVGP